MIKLGEIQPLMIVKKTDFGVYLGTEADKVLLPAKYTDEEMEIGDSVTVFVYKDSMDRPVATTRTPLLTLGKIAVLKVKEVTGIGAFLDWGLEKDLFLPFKEQTVHVAAGREYPVALYVDKSSRLCATMKLYHHLKTTDAYKTGDSVKGIAYEKIDKFGMFVAVDNIYQGLIPNKELYGKLEIGDTVTATVSKVTEDGKLELKLRAPSYLQIDDDAAKILDALNKSGGRLPVGDKSSPEEIKEAFDMSKAAFKRAIGHLFKERLIEIAEKEIILK